MASCLSIIILYKLDIENASETTAVINSLSNTLTKEVFRYGKSLGEVEKEIVLPKLRNVARQLLPDCEGCFTSFPNFVAKKILDHVCNEASCFYNLKKTFVFIDKLQYMFGERITRLGTLVYFMYLKSL